MKMKPVGSETNFDAWWTCENDACKERLARVIGGKPWAPAILEILGPEGNAVRIRHRYIQLFCSKCGEENSLIAGLGSDAHLRRVTSTTPVDGIIDNREFDQNLRLFMEEMDPLIEDDFGLDSFYVNDYKRKVLLGKLTPLQRKVFEALKMSRGTEYLYQELADSLEISKAEFSTGALEVRLKAADVEYELAMSKMRKQEDAFRKTKSELRNKQRPID